MKSDVTAGVRGGYRCRVGPVDVWSASLLVVILIAIGIAIHDRGGGWGIARQVAFVGAITHGSCRHPADR